MVIDSHIHFGKALNWDLPEQDLIRYVYEYNIDYAIISNISGVEFDNNMNKIDLARQYPQIQLNRRTAQLVKEYPDKLKGLCWIKPHIEECTKEFEQFLEENKDCFCGMKIHPHYSAMQITDERIVPFIKLCRRYNWPCIVHGAGDAYSSPQSIYEAAKRYPDVQFVMVHIGTGENHAQATAFINELSNLYGDTTWLDGPAVVKMITSCGSHKILFGTDAIMQGVHTADYYLDTIDYLKTHLKGKELEDIFCKNAVRLFNLKLNFKEVKVLF